DAPARKGRGVRRLSGVAPGRRRRPWPGCRPRGAVVGGGSSPHMSCPQTETWRPTCRTRSRMHRMSQRVKLAVVRGDGIGTEVVEQGLAVLDAALAGTDLEVTTTELDLGAARWHRTGETLTDEDLATI